MDTTPTAAATAALAETSLSALLRRNRSIVAAGMAGTCGVIVGYPFDFVKSRMQTHGFRTMSEVVKDTIKHEGTAGFFRGIVPPLLTVSVIKSLSFNMYESAKVAFAAAHAETGETVGDAIAAGFVTGTTIAVISSPLELIKLQMQLQSLAKRLDPNAPQFKGNFDCARQIYKSRGVSGFYLGFWLMYLREAVGTAVYFATYESINRVFSPTGKRSDASAFVHFWAGGLAGTASWLTVFPVDLVKSRLQKDALAVNAQYSGTMHCIKATYNASGIRGFYAGIGPTLIRAFPIHSINFMVYEYFLKLLA